MILRGLKNFPNFSQFPIKNLSISKTLCLAGVLTLALPVPVIVSNFQFFYKKDRLLNARRDKHWSEGKNGNINKKFLDLHLKNFIFYTCITFEGEYYCVIIEEQNIWLFWVRRCEGANEFKCSFLMIFRSHFCMCRLLIFLNISDFMLFFILFNPFFIR